MKMFMWIFLIAIFFVFGCTSAYSRYCSDRGGVAVVGLYGPACVVEKK